MIGFDLLCDLKEVESMEKSHTVIQHQLQNPQETCRHSYNLSLGPTNVLDILGLSRSHAIGKRASRNPKLLSQSCLPVTKD